MAKLTLDGLKDYRAKAAAKLNAPASDAEGTHIVVYMGTCGIAAGARATLDVFAEEMERAGIAEVSIRQTGCMGLCHSEPNVEVKVPGMPPVVYGRVDEEAARKIISQHIGRKMLVNDHVYDKPAADIVIS